MSAVDGPIVGGGPPAATAEQAAAYFLANDARRVDDAGVAEVVNAAYEVGGLVGVRADLALSQIAHETAVLAFGGQVAPEQHNPAGLGSTNDGAAGLAFPDWRTGVMAYYVHLLTWAGRDDLAYLVAVSPESLDPRAPLVRRVRAEQGPATTWRDLGGRWAVPGTGYGDGIQKHHAAILATPQEQPSMSLSIREATDWSGPNRPGLPMVPTYITVHETANANAGANAEMHRRFVQSGGGSEGVSFHWVVDDHEAVHLVPDDEAAWHAGDGYDGVGNRQSIAIETCVNADGDWAATRRNLAQLVALLLRRHGIGLVNVVQHNRWSGKDCPHIIRRDGLWVPLLADIQAAYRAQGPRPGRLLNAWRYLLTGDVPA